MTKKEMVYEIISNTKLCGLSEKDVQAIINKNSKSRITEVYNAFEGDKEHALAFYTLLAMATL